MKLNKLFITGGVAVAAMTFTSCVGDLDLLPTNPNEITASTFADDPEAYMRQVMADVYLNISTFGPDGTNILESMDGGMSTFQRSIFNLEEIMSDEASWLPTGDAIPHSFQFGDITSANTVTLGAYNRMQLICSLCNQFIQTDFELKTPEQEALREEFVRQAKILRSGMYFYLISEFGNVPLNDDNIAIGEIAPQLSPDFATGRRLVTESVVNTLEEIVSWYKANDPNNKPSYGYVGLDVAEALLVKFYLNYEVFTGAPAWDKCFSHAQSVIARHQGSGFVASDGVQTGLAKNYFQNFSFNNVYENEIIWRIVSQNADVFSGVNPGNVGVLNWANGGLMLNGWIGGAQQTYYNSGQGWTCIVARTQFVEVFDWNADYTESPDARVTWWQTKKHGFPIENPNLAYADWGSNGYLAVKFVNWYVNDNGSVSADKMNFFDYKKNDKDEPVDEAGNVLKLPEDKDKIVYTTQKLELPVPVVYEDKSPTPVSDICIDFGMIRLGEIYLSAAEAALNGGGSTADALKYVNYIRERAEMPAYTTINLTELRKERQRELYTECTRRTDLVRYGQWVSGYNWNWKNHVATGADFPPYFNVFPIPNTVVVNNGYTQNPGW